MTIASFSPDPWTRAMEESDDDDEEEDEEDEAEPRGVHVALRKSLFVSTRLATPRMAATPTNGEVATPIPIPSSPRRITSAGSGSSPGFRMRADGRSFKTIFSDPQGS